MSVGEVEFRSLVIERADFGIVFLGGEVILAEAKVDDFELVGVMVDEDIEGLDVAVHDAFGVDVIESLCYEWVTSKSFLM